MRITEKQLRSLIRETLEEAENPCWDGYSPGAKSGKKTKKGKSGKTVANCEKISESGLNEDKVKITRKQLRDLIKEASEQELKALRQSSPDIAHPKDVVDAVLAAMTKVIPGLSHEVTERDAKGALNALHIAGYKVVKG